MLRSLFIGLLILSTLASKGVGVHINENITNISADMLLEFINNTVDYAEKQDELSAANSAGVFLYNTSSSSAIEELISSIRNNSPIVWDTPDDKNRCISSYFLMAELQQKQFSTGEIYSYGADLSPPNCI